MHKKYPTWTPMFSHAHEKSSSNLYTHHFKCRSGSNRQEQLYDESGNILGQKGYLRVQNNIHGDLKIIFMSHVN